MIPDVANMLYQKIEANHKEAIFFYKSISENLESLREEFREYKVAKDAIIKKLEQRVAKLEAQQNPTV
jgi:hypothetical protein